MQFSKLSMGLAALAMVAAPAVAQSSFAPAVAPLSGDEEGQAEGSGIILGLLGAGVVVAAIVVASDSDDTELPVSN